nr:HNH endonuclease signature motif containing protein [Arthrobacter jiangjiafuii]
MPWCGAPIRHFDHIKPFRDGGTTSAENLQGLCEACNQAKEAPGWSMSTVSAGPAALRGASHTVETRTPTGHLYRSAAPPLPGTGNPVQSSPSGCSPTGVIARNHSGSSM